VAESEREHAVLLIVDQIDPRRKSSEDRSRNEGRYRGVLRFSVLRCSIPSDTVRSVPARIAEDPRALIRCRSPLFLFFLLSSREPPARPSIGPASSEISSITFLTRLIPVVSRCYRGPSRLPRGCRGWRGLSICDPSINRDYVRVIVVYESTRGDCPTAIFRGLVLFMPSRCSIFGWYFYLCICKFA